MKSTNRSLRYCQLQVGIAKSPTGNRQSPNIGLSNLVAPLNYSLSGDVVNKEHVVPMNVELPSNTIRLDHFLQLCGVPTGGQAKMLIQQGLVNVNDVVETRRRRKLAQGDTVSIEGEIYEVEMSND
ncbi:MAG: RNA-binding S4 domain-containing protein [Pirellulaceae bacterium]|nr:RNA-binding S4 domain-containing protein [Pirellulaceae bacterium]